MKFFANYFVSSLFSSSGVILSFLGGLSFFIGLIAFYTSSFDGSITTSSTLWYRGILHSVLHNSEVRKTLSPVYHVILFGMCLVFFVLYSRCVIFWSVLMLGLFEVILVFLKCFEVKWFFSSAVHGDKSVCVVYPLSAFVANFYVFFFFFQVILWLTYWHYNSFYCLH